MAGTDLKVLVGLALAFVVGVLLNVIASFVDLGDPGRSALPLTAMIFYFLAPWPNFLFDRCGGGGFDLDDKGRVWKDLGFFLTGFLIVSGLALPAVLAHANQISFWAMILSLAGGAIIFGAITLYAHFFKSKDPLGL